MWAGHALCEPKAVDYNRNINGANSETATSDDKSKTGGAINLGCPIFFFEL